VPQLAPFNYTLKYDVTWNGLPIGHVRIITSESDYRYTLTVETKTRGILRLFDGTKSTIRTEGRYIEKDGREDVPSPQNYESRAKNSDRTKITTVRYNMQGEIIKRERNPADDPTNRPVVPLEKANKAVDPLTGIYVARQMLRDNIERNIRDTTVRTYDGARLADLTFKVVSRASLEVLGESTNAINIVLKRTPIDGYKKKELKKYNEGDPVIHVYFSADERFIPLAADVKLKFGTISAKLASAVETKK
jgi:hypothetical protein